MVGTYNKMVGGVILIIMKTLSLEKDLVIALYTYLRQAELSIDRSLGGFWNNLGEYYRTEAIHPKIIVAVLAPLIEEYSANFFTTLHSINPKKETQKQTGILTWLDNLWSWYFNNTLRLERDEFIFIYQSLCEFEKSLTTTQQPSPEQIVSVRRDLYTSWNLIRRKIPFCEFCKKAEYVKHFNSNEHLILLEFSEIADDRYLRKP